MSLEQLSLYRCLEIKPPAVVSFYGAGGKTTLISRLAAEMNALGLKTLFTTTTKIAKPLSIPLFCNFSTRSLLNQLKEHYRDHSSAVLGTKLLADGKIEGITPDLVNHLYKELGITTLVEADGSRGLPLKGYAPYEPVLPPCSEYIIAVAGADALYAPFDQRFVHRPKELYQVVASGKEKTISETTLALAFKHMLDLGEKQAPQAQAFFILNKVDVLANPGPVLLKIAGRLTAEQVTAKRLFSTEATFPEPVKIDLNLNKPKKLVSVSCVILAAGESSRMGKDKMALQIKDKTILETTLEQVKASRIKDIVIVVRPDSIITEKIKAGNYKVIENVNYKKGLSQSLKLGLQAVDNNAQGVIFALGDQPLIPPWVYRFLVEGYAKNLKPVTIPTCQGQRGNPVLFDRKIWPALMELEGDQGGRQIISRLTQNEVDQIETGATEILFDVDTKEDYNNLR
ncbi:MAG: selenium cofactor biosynthesis protein YqeC [Bacillota bacterium]